MIELNQFPGSCHSWPSPGDTVGPLRPAQAGAKGTLLWEEIRGHTGAQET